jgi:branched-chain amino acid transport system substrate-binding protein
VQGRTLKATVAAIAIAAAGCGGGGGAKKAAPLSQSQIWKFGDIHFGVLAPLSGSEAARGKDLVDGATLAAEDLNVRGGVLGKQVKLDALDDGCDAATSRASAEQLASRTLGGALGTLCDTAATAAARTLGDMPFLVTGANSQRIVSAKRTPTAYLTEGTPYQAALATIHFLSYQNAQRLATVSSIDPADVTLSKQVLGLSSPAPISISEQHVDVASADWAEVAKTALTHGPDTVYFAGPADAAGKLLAALHAAGFKDRFVASAQSDSPAFLQAAGAAGQGAYVIAPATPQNLPQAADWSKRFKARFGHAPGRDAMLAYEGLRTLAQAVTQTGKIDPKAATAELPRLQDDYKDFLGEALQFAADHTIKYDDNIALQVSGGAFKVDSTLRSYQG